MNWVLLVLGHRINLVTALPYKTVSSDPWALTGGSSDDTGADRSVRPVVRVVEPLDQQLGVWPKKTVPDGLSSDVFGKSWAFSYALLDAARINDLAELLERRSLPAVCLFDGDAAWVGSGSAPWLVELGEDDRLTRSLFTAGKSGNALWNAGCGIIVRSNLSLQDLRARFRKITQFYDDQLGKWIFLRFWDPRFARYLLAYGSAEMGLRMLGSGSMMMRGPEADEVQIWTLPEAFRNVEAQTPFRLRAADHHALKLARLDNFVTKVLAWLRSAYGGLPAGIDERQFILGLAAHARDVLNLKTERTVSDYIAASWLLRMPVEQRLDISPRRHEIPQATLARIHDLAYEIFEAGS